MPELHEWKYGKFDGLTTKQIQEDTPSWNVFLHGAPEGESPADVSARADTVIARVRQKSGNIALFSHAHFLRALAARWIGMPVDAGRYLLLHTASVSILGYEHHSPDEPAIELWNSTCQPRKAVI